MNNEQKPTSQPGQKEHSADERFKAIFTYRTIALIGLAGFAITTYAGIETSKKHTFEEFIQPTRIPDVVHYRDSLLNESYRAANRIDEIVKETYFEHAMNPKSFSQETKQEYLRSAQEYARTRYAAEQFFNANYKTFQDWAQEQQESSRNARLLALGTVLMLTAGALAFARYEPKK